MDSTPTLEQAVNTIELLQESLADVEHQLARDNHGWTPLDGIADDGLLTDRGRHDAIRLSRIMATMNPLVKNAVSIRAGYVWGGGVAITVRDDPNMGQDVNQVVQSFLDDPDVVETWSGMQAREDAERALCTDGERFIALPTDPLTGKVGVAIIDPREVTRIITDPGNARRPLFYRREWQTIDTSGRATGRTTTAYYPAIGYRPVRKPRSIDGVRVEWDAPLLHVAVNRVGGDLRGIPDLLPALPWARLYKEFLEAWSTLMRALSRFAWRARNDKTSKAAQAITAAQHDVGRAAINLDMEAIPKTGATIDSNSARPLAMMVASAIGVPVTMLLGDPGATGARAVAETLTEPTQNGFKLRREVHRVAILRILDHVIDSAIIAPAGPLTGRVERDGDRLRAVLPVGDDRQVTVEFPDFDTTPVLDKVRALQLVDGTDKLDELTMARLLLQAVGVADVDGALQLITDDQGRWIPPETRRADAAEYAAARGGIVQ